METYIAHGLDTEVFKDYGHVISEKSGKPLADEDQFSYWDKVSELDIDKPVSTGIVIGHSDTFSVEGVERHLETPEILVALSGDFVALLGKPDNSTDDVKGLKAFYVKQGEAIAMEKGTWHSPPISVQDECKVLVVFKSGTPDDDLEVKDLIDKVEIKLD